MAKHSLHIAVFCKPLVPGQVKTRLIPVYGADAATRIYSQLVERTLQTVRAASELLDTSASLWVAGDVAHPSTLDWATRFGLSLHEQCLGDLGAKMLHCLSTMAEDHDRVILIGTDCPVLDVEHLRTAASFLTRECNWIFTPAEDGGYVLVASNAPTLQPFTEITWSTPQVMAQTRAAVRASKLTWKELDTLWDVDVAADVERARAAGLIDKI